MFHVFEGKYVSILELDLNYTRNWTRARTGLLLKK